MKIEANKHPSGTTALHGQEGNDHIVSLSSLRVMLLKDGDGWFAQALEIDYCAYGSSVDKVKELFSSGLCKTVHEHLEMHGRIDGLLSPAPKEAWAEFTKSPADTIKQSFTTIQFHRIVEEKLKLPSGVTEFPYDTIAFLSREPELAEVA
jgi:hypothetical protein